MVGGMIAGWVCEIGDWRLEIGDWRWEMGDEILVLAGAGMGIVSGVGWGFLW